MTCFASYSRQASVSVLSGICPENTRNLRRYLSTLSLRTTFFPLYLPTLLTLKTCEWSVCINMKKKIVKFSTNLKLHPYKFKNHSYFLLLLQSCWYFRGIRWQNWHCKGGRWQYWHCRGGRWQYWYLRGARWQYWHCRGGRWRGCSSCWTWPASGCRTRWCWCTDSCK